MARARRELLFCAAEFLLNLTTLLFLAELVTRPAALVEVAQGADVGASAGSAPRPIHPAWLPPVTIAAFAALLVALAVLPRAARWLGGVHRLLAARLLGELIERPPPPRQGRGALGWLIAGARDGAGWRVTGYALVKLPVTIGQFYATTLAVTGAADVTYPFWWGLFRNHPPGVTLRPAAVVTPFGIFHVATFPGTAAAFAAGVAMLLAAPWVARASASADRWLMRRMLGPGRAAVLAATRALAVDDSAALLRRVERDLHDGAQIRLATLALNLGLAKEKLDSGDAPSDLASVRELVDAAHQGAKDALSDLRDLARGIHPPVLDNGLPDALASLAASSPIPVEFNVAIPARPTPAIESIAYFCAAELLANAVKHGRPTVIGIDAAGTTARLRLTVTDNGPGGADPAAGTGLAGLTQRVSTVDGRLDVTSPPGGPTRITVDLPLRA